MPLHFLTDEEVALLQRVIDAHHKNRINTPSRPPTERSFSDREDHQAPETYIAFPQDEDGIPALTPNVGTADDDYDEPGVATCDIYRIIVTDGTPKLQPISGLEREVYNLSENAVPQAWLTVTRDKFGQWLPFDPGTGRMIHGTVLGAATGTGGGFSSSDETFSIDNVVAIFGANPTAAVTGTGPTDDDLEIYNVHNFSGDAGDRATCVYCQEDARWECIQVDCPS